MKQVLLTRKGPSADEVPAPTLEPGTVLVAVVRSCISVGTELSGVRRSATPLWRLARRYPEHVKKALELAATHGVRRTWGVIQGQLDAGTPVGYSAAGVVIEAASDVSDLRPGDRVACAGAQCAHHAEVIRVPRNLVVPIPTAVGFEDASAVALGAIALQGVRRAQPTLGETFVVIGLGALGQLTLQMLHANGCHVIGVDIDARRLAVARRFGCSLTIDASAGAPTEQVARATRGIGADGVIITAATADDSVASSAFRMCRRKGRVVLVGDVGLNLRRADLYQKELDFFISCSYGPGRYDDQYETSGVDYPIGYVRWTENRNMAEFLRLVELRRVEVQPLVAHTYPVDRSAEAYAALQSGDRPLLVVLSYPRAHMTEPRATVVRNPRALAPRPGRIRVAVIGAGGFAKAVHLPNLSTLNRLCALRAVVSRSGHNAAAAARQFGAAYCTTEYREVLNDRDVDAVIIATRHHLHTSMALEALAAGKHVLLEKPLAIAQADLDRLAAFFADADRPQPILLTGFNRRFSPHAARMREWLAGRADPVMIDYRMNAGYLAPDHWTQGPQGGGRNLGEACHIYDLFTYLTGARVQRVDAAAIAPATGYYRRNDNFTATLTFGDGSIATLTYTALGHADHAKERAEVFAGGTVISLDDYRSVTVTGARRSALRTRRPDKGQHAELEAFLRAVGSGGPWPSALWEQRQATQIALDVERALNRAS